MKAIFEFDAPESCVVCPLGHGNPIGRGKVCGACKQVFSDAYSKQDERAPFCPLKIITDDAPTVDAVTVGWIEFEKHKPPDTKFQNCTMLLFLIAQIERL